MGEKDIEKLTVEIQQLKLSARVRVEGASSERQPILVLVPDAPARTRINAHPDENGFVAIEGLSPGRYRFSVSFAGYLKEARLGPVVMLQDGLIDIDAVSVTNTLEAVVSRGGTVVGSVRNAAQQPREGIRIVLVPNSDRRQRWDLYKTSFTDASGNFQLSNVAPGDYKLFAWADIHDGQWQSEQFVTSREREGKALHITEEGTQRADLILP